ncbi:hypothetical protein BLNAU_11525 [Blattamonas nauphoetae]|uniref:WW domain-containing protein n=1 Tax=Blattamonas nauphoetae TaxID=2049346 RepID=A0ABQ9XPV6_9EUKA|nr:hypothetical protein BLNAU_11525 [Blattamonas nauphoetae]
MSDSLPPGWKEYQDKKSGRSYYYNKETKERSWKKPQNSNADPPTESAPTLPPGWVEKTEKSSGRKYYYNKSLKKSSWTIPQTDVPPGIIFIHLVHLSQIFSICVLFNLL